MQLKNQKFVWVPMWYIHIAQSGFKITCMGCHPIQLSFKLPVEQAHSYLSVSPLFHHTEVCLCLCPRPRGRYAPGGGWHNVMIRMGSAVLSLVAQLGPLPGTSHNYHYNSGSKHGAGPRVTRSTRHEAQNQRQEDDLLVRQDGVREEHVSTQISVDISIVNLLTLRNCIVQFVARYLECHGCH